VSGLQVVGSGKSFTAPTSYQSVFLAGIEHQAALSRFKLLINVKSHILESQLTYKLSPRSIVGWNLVLDPHSQKVTKYDFGATFEPTDRLLVGVRHESNSDNKSGLGKFFVHFFHNASVVETIGSEFGLDWEKKQLEARFGLQHTFSSDLTGKFRVNHLGFADAVLKLKLSQSVTANFSTGLDLKGITAPKAKQLPVGFTFDLKL